MKMNGVYNAVFVIAALALSLVLAISGFGFDTWGGIRTPGILVVEALAKPDSRPDFAKLGPMFRTQLFVDWVFWFALLCGIYFLITRVGRRFQGRR